MMLGPHATTVVAKTNRRGCICPHQVHLAVDLDLALHPRSPIAGVHQQAPKSFALQIFGVAHRGRKNA